MERGIFNIFNNFMGIDFCDYQRDVNAIFLQLCMSEYVYTRNFVLLAGTLVYVILNFILNIEDLKLWTCQMCAIYPIARAIIKGKKLLMLFVTTLYG